LAQAAKAAGYKSTQMIRKAVQEGELPAFKMARLKYLVKKEDLIKWILTKRIHIKKVERPAFLVAADVADQ
jgi:excisionase family DNA binding protein